MIKRLLLVASTNKRLEKLVSTSHLTRGLVSRLVAGTTLQEAITVTRELRAEGIDVSLDPVRAIAENSLGATVSVKLSQLGIGLDPAVCAGSPERAAAGSGRRGRAGRHRIDRQVDTASEYALTCSIFAGERGANGTALDALRDTAGTTYVNDKPTGALIGRQAFGGGRASGTAAWRTSPTSDSEERP